MFGAAFNPRVLGSLLLVGALLAVAFWPATVVVDVTVATRGPLVVTVDEEGQTRVKDRFVISTPVSGRVLRIDLEPGDAVKRGDVVANVRAEAPSLLDARTRAETEAVVEAARAALGRSRAEEQRAKATLAQAERELGRVRELAAEELATAREVDGAQAEVDVASEALKAAAFAVRASSSELQRAEARLVSNAPDTAGVVTVTAPADGVVLRRIRESESVVPAGEPLLEIGDPEALEVVSDLLTTDAVRVQPGARATVEQWGGEPVLDATVRRIEPSGFTKISALGVEEQRVNVILDFADPASAWSALGDAYRVEVRIVVWEAADIVKVPTGALFRQGEDWAVYVVEGDRANATVVEVGHQTGREAEIISGVSEGQPVILHPGDTLSDGVSVERRGQNSGVE
jgi:HlyD family secretion protein